jgi:hypothetical protein
MPRKCSVRIVWTRFSQVKKWKFSDHLKNAREQNGIFIGKPYFCRIRCVKNETIVANIVSRKSYTRNLLVAFKFSNFHFYVQNCRFRAFFCRFTANQAKIQKSTSYSMFTNPWSCYIPKMTFLAFPQKKPCIMFIIR